jgi:hypothetical protein
LKDKLIKIGAKVVSRGRYVIFQMARVSIARQMFQEILLPIWDSSGESRPEIVGHCGGACGVVTAAENRAE